MKQQHSKILLIILIISFFTACNSVKRVASDAHLLTKTNLLVNDKKVTTEAINNLLYQRSNKKIPLINLPLRLHIYNTARPNIDSILISRLNNNPKKKHRLERFLSKKQLKKHLLSRKSFNNWIKQTGEAPVIVNDTLTKKTLTRLEKYYYNHGWFDVKSASKTNREDNKRATIDYSVTTGNPYIIDSISTKIASPVVDSIYKTVEKASVFKLGEQYNTLSILSEKERITNAMRNSGVYHFSQDYFYFEVDTFGKTKTVKIDVQIKDRVIREDEDTYKKPFNIYTIKDVNIFTNSAFENKDKPIVDTTVYNGINIYSIEKLRYNPKMLTNAIFIKPNTVFKDINRPRTSRRISDLKTFKYPRIDYIENSDTTLTANIYLNPEKRFSLGFNAEASQSNIQSVGFALNPSLIFNNLFRGAETLEISGVGAIGASKDGAGDRDHFFDINEIGANLNLTIPRLFSPFNTEKIIPNHMFPSTKLSVAATSQTNIGLDKQTFTGTFNYKWYPNTRVTNRLDLFNVQFVKNLNTSNYFGVYESSFNTLNTIAINSGYIDSGETLSTPTQSDQFLADVIGGGLGDSISDNDTQTVNYINERKNRLTEDNLIFSTNFNYVKDKRDNLFDNDFSIFRLKLELAGNMFAATSKILGLEKNNDDKFELFNVAYSQYLKTELDYIKHWDLGNKNVLAVRSFFGIAIPFGNSTNIPFSKSFFAGGANDNRAWTAYNLGPGSSETTNEFNEANLKIALSAESRFNLFGALNGALFIDAGNIWNALDDVEDDSATFDSLSSLKDIAVGSGFGLRWDFNFFVLRGDIGFKTYDPSYKDNNRWFNDYNFSNAVYNVGINYPF